MDSKLLLVKCINLLYRESQLKDRTENSSDLVKTVLDEIKVGDFHSSMNTDREVILNLRDTALDMCNDPMDHVYDLSDLLQRIKINTLQDQQLYEIIKQGLENELSEISLKRVILNTRKTLNNYFKQRQLVQVIKSASETLHFNLDKIKDINEFIVQLMAQLEPLQTNGNGKDPAVVNDLDLSDDDAVQKIFDEVKNTNDGTSILKTGWQAINKMLAGGFRRGESVLIGGLQHKNKTGSTLSLFAQIALNNTPVMLDNTKKPLLLRISFEDDLYLNLQFLYIYLKYDETLQYVDIKDLTKEEMTTYVKKRLHSNGYNIKMLRVDPSQWTYRSICNKVIELEAQGYEIHLLMLDYLFKIPTTGCSTGALGHDKRDLFRRIRNFCSPLLN